MTARDVKAAGESITEVPTSQEMRSKEEEEAEETSSDFEYFSSCFRKVISQLKPGNKQKAIILLETIKVEIEKW